MKNQKGFVILIVIGIIAILVVGGAYMAERRLNSSRSEWLTYENRQYGFTFQYPANWKLKEDTYKKSVTIDSGIISDIGGPQSPIETLSLNIKVIDNGAFGRVNSKVGEIRYDSSLGGLVDGLDNPIRCLPATYRIGVLSSANISVPAYQYTGSMMSDPAYGGWAVLTNKDYMLLINTSRETTGDKVTDDALNEGEGKIYSSLSFLGDVRSRVSSCVSNNTL